MDEKEAEWLAGVLGQLRGHVLIEERRALGAKWHLAAAMLGAQARSLTVVQTMLLSTLPLPPGTPPKGDDFE
jgi:hypothetical protein